MAGSYIRVRWELLERLRPHLILTTTGVQNPLTLELRRHGYGVFPVPLSHSPWGVLENAVLIGDLLKMDATPLVDDLVRRLLRLRGVGRGLRVYMEFDLGGPITIGRASYLAAALRWMGMMNVYDHEPRRTSPPTCKKFRSCSRAWSSLSPNRGPEPPGGSLRCWPSGAGGLCRLTFTPGD